jgi:hypothetical protein
MLNRLVHIVTTVFIDLDSKTRISLDPAEEAVCNVRAVCLSVYHVREFVKKHDKFITVGFKGGYSFYFLFEG